ncbi:serine/threonine-protein kinase [Granulicella sp. L46]|uniref:serine/threonine-protein kinase n=1 Tax=Granulicella sp. L46 TaxID=1641865 RepID=UPI00131DB35A|nr:serine/threonine-protein kinase [Granulicella sp. L46]
MIAPNLTLRPGDTLDGYELEDIVATSGMATVFRARDLKSGLQVAIKVPHPEVESDPTMFDRFRREEEIGTRIDHPGVMKVFANPERTQIYMVMEWLDGRLLRQILNEKKKLPVERAVKLMVGICDALDHVHANGVAHRDLKPENIMVDDADGIHLIDFGIAASAGARRLTFAHFSQSMGTPDYISPEQVRGKRGDSRSDIYALGVMLYEMLTGVVPFSGPNPFAVMNDRLLNQPVPPRELEPSISPQLQEIVYRAMEREPKNRYASAREMAHDLQHQDEVGVAARPDAERWRTRRSPERRRMLLYAGLALIPALLFGLLLFVSRHH